jgi:hypothetical protein
MSSHQVYISLNKFNRNKEEGNFKKEITVAFISTDIYYITFTPRPAKCQFRNEDPNLGLRV